jgi:hypothetical protein
MRHFARNSFAYLTPQLAPRKGPVRNLGRSGLLTRSRLLTRILEGVLLEQLSAQY